MLPRCDLSFWIRTTTMKTKRDAQQQKWQILNTNAIAAPLQYRAASARKLRQTRRGRLGQPLPHYRHHKKVKTGWTNHHVLCGRGPEDVLTDLLRLEGYPPLRLWECPACARAREFNMGVFLRPPPPPRKFLLILGDFFLQKKNREK